jgi:hypothetical protein
MPDQYADQKAKAEADTATAKAREAEASADTAAAKAKQAVAEAAAKEALAIQSAQTAADKDTADAQNSAAVTAKATAEADKAAAEADKAKAEARTAAASATTAEAKAGIPDVPTLPKIENPEDKSVSVTDTGGAGTATYTAAQALEGLGEDVGLEVAWALHAPNIQKPRRYRDPRFDAMGLPDRAASQDGTTSDDTATAAPVKTVWIMDSMTPSEAGIVLMELRGRLTAFTKQLDDTFAAAPSAPTKKAGDEKEIDDLLASITKDDIAVQGVGGGLHLSALNPAGWAISTAGALVNFGVQLVSALRSKYSLYGRQVNLNRQALLSATAGVLLTAGLKVGWTRFSAANRSSLIEQFTAACTARDGLDSRLPAKEPQEAVAKEPYQRAKKLIERFDTYSESIMTAPAGGGQSPFLEAALFESSLPPASEDREDYLLYEDISASGADAITGYGIVNGSTAAFLGFVQAYFTVTTRDGSLVWAGTSTIHTNARLDLKSGVITETTSSDWLNPQDQ